MNTQKHPQEKNDRELVDKLLKGQPNDLNLAELARMRIRYRGFPGAKSIQRDLDKLLAQWQLEEETLFEKTRLIHSKGQVYKKNQDEEEHWS
ncbi:MAG: hypothetical protein N5P05_003801 [Chroococcopsis gigantea SAG 12.99]|jgi:hypothetical protein|nr:DUF3288 family protein [Chlorogloea purpurea SAG 13.99]MDV3002195.1 hypothetical protein [Chroococcopsis gigantea SAG 12.99]